MVLVVAAVAVAVATAAAVASPRVRGSLGIAGTGAQWVPPAAGTPTTPGPDTRPASTRLIPQPVAVSGTSFFGWALLDRRTGRVSGSANRESAVSSTESTIKAWIAADYLRRRAAAGRAPTDAALRDLTSMIVDNDDLVAQRYYLAGGGDAVVSRLVSTCRLKHTTVYKGWWSKTRMTPADAARYGECLASGRAAGPKWTTWLLRTMTQVRGGVDDQRATSGGGRWGIVSALSPGAAATTSIKNGWAAYQGVWRVDCLAVQQDWVLAVMVRYPSGDGLGFGADVCESVTEQLMRPAPAPSG